MHDNPIKKVIKIAQLTMHSAEPGISTDISLTSLQELLEKEKTKKGIAAKETIDTKAEAVEEKHKTGKTISQVPESYGLPGRFQNNKWYSRFSGFDASGYVTPPVDIASLYKPNSPKEILQESEETAEKKQAAEMPAEEKISRETMEKRIKEEMFEKAGEPWMAGKIHLIDDAYNTMKILFRTAYLVTKMQMYSVMYV